MTTLPDRLRAIYVAEGANYVQEAAREIERLTAEVAGLREDAARYRYLRDVAWHSGSLIFYAERYGPEDWDEQIDAARKGAP